MSILKEYERIQNNGIVFLSWDTQEDLQAFLDVLEKEKSDKNALNICEYAQRFWYLSDHYAGGWGSYDDLYADQAATGYIDLILANVPTGTAAAQVVADEYLRYKNECETTYMDNRPYGVHKVWLNRLITACALKNERVLKRCPIKRFPEKMLFLGERF